MEKENNSKPAEILLKWIKAVNYGKVDELLAMYDANAILIPTFSNRILNTPEKIRTYFEMLGSRKELCVALHEKTLNVQMISEQFYSISGIYCWRFEVDEELLSFEARFSYTLNVDSPSPIINHHSSQIPRTL